VFCSRSSCKYFVVNNSHRHHHSTSSPLTIVTHHHQSRSSSVVVITCRGHHQLSPSPVVVITRGRHHQSWSSSAVIVVTCRSIVCVDPEVHRPLPLSLNIDHRHRGASSFAGRPSLCRSSASLKSEDRSQPRGSPTAGRLFS